MPSADIACSTPRSAAVMGDSDLSSAEGRRMEKRGEGIDTDAGESA